MANEPEEMPPGFEHLELSNQPTAPVAPIDPSLGRPLTIGGRRSPSSMPEGFEHPPRLEPSSPSSQPLPFPGAIQTPSTVNKPSEAALSRDAELQRAAQEKALSVAKEASRATLGEAAKAIPSVLAGGIPSVVEFFGSDVPTLIRNQYYNLGKDRFWSEETAEAGKAQPPVGSELKPYAPSWWSPYSEWRKTIDPKVEAYSPEWLGKPETALGKIASRGVEGAAQAGPMGSLRTMGPRLVSGAGGGSGAEIGKIVSGGENPSQTVLLELIGGLAGGIAAPKLLPSAKKTIEEAFTRDLSRLPAEERARIIEQLKSGNHTIVDFAGDNTKQAILRAAGLSPKNIDSFNAFVAAQREIADGSIPRLQNTIKGSIEKTNPSFVQYTDDIANLENAINTAAKAENKAMYGIAYANPSANNIPVGRLINGPMLSNPLWKEAETIANREHGGLGIVAPIKNNRIGNLAWAQTVDSEFSRLLREAKRVRSASDPILEEWTNQQRRFRDALEQFAPGYKKAVFTAAKNFKGMSAPEAGADMSKTILSAAAQKNPYTRSEVLKEFNSFSPEQKDAIRAGMLASIAEVSAKDIKGLLNKLDLKKSPSSASLFRDVLGSDIYNSVAGSVASEAIRRQVAGSNWTIRQGLSAGQSTAVGAGYGVGAIAAAEGIFNILQQKAFLSGDPSAAARYLAAAGAGAVFSGIKSFRDRKEATQLLQYALSNDPKKLQQLGDLLNRGGRHSDIYGKILANIGVASTTLNKEYAYRLQQNQSQQGQASGGRIERKSGGRISPDAEADLLIRAADSAKKGIQQETKGILNSPDEHVVKALKVAKENLEG